MASCSPELSRAGDGDNHRWFVAANYGAAHHLAQQQFSGPRIKGGNRTVDAKVSSTATKYTRPSAGPGRGRAAAGGASSRHDDKPSGSPTGGRLIARGTAPSRHHYGTPSEP